MRASKQLPRFSARAWVRRAAHVLSAIAGLTTLAHARVDVPLLVTQVPARNAPRGVAAESLVRPDWYQGARIVVVAPTGETRVLSAGLESACDPNVSFDGQRVLFAGRKDAAANWRIWEIGIDGTGLRAITPETLDARSPIHVSGLFTLNSPEPWFTTVFVGRERTRNEQGRDSVSHLYNIKLDGGELRRLTFNPNHNLDPVQMWDGRVIYAAERYPNQPPATAGRVGLFAIHMEGADMESYGGGLGQRLQQMPCTTPGGLMVFVESSQPTPDGGGQLACVDERRPHRTYRALTKDAAYRYLHPSALKDNEVLVARRAVRGKATYGIVRFNADSGRTEAVFDSPDHHDVQAVPVQPRPRPDGHSTVVNTTSETGIFYGLNCYTSDAAREPQLKKGEVKRVRFIEGVVPAGGNRPSNAAGPYIARRLIGEAPVEADGSFNVEVPADTPLLLQTVDEQGLALSTCGWIWVKPKETRGCIGCHEDPERTPENEYVLSLRRPSNRLVAPPAERRTVTFREDVAPILQKHCATAECHGGNDTPLPLRSLLAKTAGTSDSTRAALEAYNAVMIPLDSSARGEWPQPGRYVDPGRARTSWLVWQVLGTNTSRPWDEPHPRGQKRKLHPMPPEKKVEPLSAAEVQTLIQWIDLGAAFGPTTSPANAQASTP